MSGKCGVLICVETKEPCDSPGLCRGLCATRALSGMPPVRSRPKVLMGDLFSRGTPVAVQKIEERALLRPCSKCRVEWNGPFGDVATSGVLDLLNEGQIEGLSVGGFAIGGAVNTVEPGKPIPILTNTEYFVSPEHWDWMMSADPNRIPKEATININAPKPVRDDEGLALEKRMHDALAALVGHRVRKLVEAGRA